MEKNKQGIIILDNFNKIEKNEIGRKKKNWFERNGKEYLFKTGASNYEILAEVISAELAKQCGIETAEYDIAMYKDQVGVVTPSFLKEGDIILSGEDLYKYSKLISPNINFCNSIENIVLILKLCTSRDYDIEKIKNQLTNFWLFDGLIYESDRNFSNWSIIINGNDIRMAPIYDCSTMCRMNNNIQSLISSFRSGYDIASLTDSIKYQLKRKNDDLDDNFLNSFYKFCVEEPEKAEDFINRLNNIDVNKAIENIEDRMNDSGEINFQVPWECNFWINKLIGYRVETLKSLYESTKTHEKKY